MPSCSRRAWSTTTSSTATATARAPSCSGDLECLGGRGQTPRLYHLVGSQRRGEASDPMVDKAPRAEPTARAVRAWQRMLSGRRLDLLDPAPKDIEVEDIAHGLARVARWNGQTVGEHAFSVAQHALLVEDIAAHMHPDLTRRWRLAALLHDAPEYVIGDLISPFKAALGLDYKAFERRLLQAIHRRFGLPASLPDRI